MKSHHRDRMGLKARSTPRERTASSCGGCYSIEAEEPGNDAVITTLSHWSPDDSEWDVRVVSALRRREDEREVPQRVDDVPQVAPCLRVDGAIAFGVEGP